MACSCIKGVYDFDLTYTSCADIRYIDRSVWMAGPGYTGGQYEVKMSGPGGDTRTFDIVVGQTAVLDLGNCVTPGVYTFEVTSCETVFTKQVAITCQLWCGWLRAVAKLGSLDTATVRTLREHLEYIDYAVSYGDIETAQTLVKSVSSGLAKINCECSCQ
jgi:hypothetical protein